ncbi:MAG: helix-turn-helix domain-containing protein [Halieaceae bacterium]|jgi:DNA-binding HxlR family transcriptional regulator|nr:helix-turn-helix domain-containing protein [Halieaceae bacterium]
MVKKSFSDMACSVAQAMDVIGEWWSMLIVRDFFVGGGRRRFEQLRDSLGISRNILTERLRTLTEAGVIEKVPLQEGGRRYAYQLTDKGLDLLPVMISIMQWWDRWEQEPEKRFMKVRVRETGEEIAPVSVQNERGDVLGYQDLIMTVCTPRGEMKIREWPLDFRSLTDDDLLELPTEAAAKKVS